MYMIQEMIDQGLKEGQKWPSEGHRVVASIIGLCNPRVVTHDSLTDIVQAVIKIPVDEITFVTYEDCATKYSVPFINLS